MFKPLFMLATYILSYLICVFCVIINVFTFIVKLFEQLGIVDCGAKGCLT